MPKNRCRANLRRRSKLRVPSPPRKRPIKTVELRERRLLDSGARHSAVSSSAMTTDMPFASHSTCHRTGHNSGSRQIRSSAAKKGKFYDIAPVCSADTGGGNTGRWEPAGLGGSSPAHSDPNVRHRQWRDAGSPRGGEGG